MKDKNCCSHDCNQGRDCPNRIKQIRRVRAGGPPPAEADELAGFPTTEQPSVGYRNALILTVAVWTLLFAFLTWGLL